MWRSKKNQEEVKGNFVYCCKYYKFLCNSCQINHPNEEHDLINIKKYDSLCKIPYLYNFYYIQCHQNLCNYYLKEYKYHNFVNLFILDYSEESMRNLERNEKFWNKNKNLDIIKEKIILNLNNYKN